MIDGRLALLASLAMTLALPSLAQTGAERQLSTPPPTSKQCESAKRKVDREQKALTATADNLARDRRAREGCTSRSACSRYDDSISDAQRRIVRREARLGRFRDEAGKACNAG